jgi:hypothetical protein
MWPLWKSRGVGGIGLIRSKSRIRCRCVPCYFELGYNLYMSSSGESYILATSSLFTHTNASRRLTCDSYLENMLQAHV